LKHLYISFYTGSERGVGKLIKLFFHCIFRIKTLEKEYRNYSSNMQTSRKIPAVLSSIIYSKTFIVLIWKFTNAHLGLVTLSLLLVSTIYYENSKFLGIDI